MQDDWKIKYVFPIAYMLVKHLKFDYLNLDIVPAPDYAPMIKQFLFVAISRLWADVFKEYRPFIQNVVIGTSAFPSLVNCYVIQ